MKEIADKLLELESLISDERDKNDSDRLSHIHSLVSSASTIAGNYSEDDYFDECDASEIDIY